MLYVFHVDTGLMLTFDMNLAMESVSKLQEAIHTSYNIPPDKQVMLISGGENLDPSERVCKYSAGTDTNPIFLFSRTTIESATPPSASINYGTEIALQDQVEGSLNMGPTYETVVARAQLALQIHEVGREELLVCERLVHDQHLQHQGWAAVVANLEDITSAFKKRLEALWVSFDEFIGSREQYSAMLDNFAHTMELLSKIPLLPCLAGEHHRLWTPERNSAASSTPSDSTTAGSSSTLSINKPDGSTCSVQLLPQDPAPFAGDVGEVSSESLLEWISAQDSRNSMEAMIAQCQNGMQQFTLDVKGELMTDMHALLEAVNNPSMKEVKGLEDRLYGLEQLMYGARKLVQEQNEMAQGFVQNQNRASNLRDNSVLPDLCQSHKRQLLVMLKNHQGLRDIRRRCTAAKDELAANLHTRLRWIMYVEKSLCDKDNKLMIHQASLRKLKRRLAILQQMADAPNVYARAVVEVVRRKTFSENFLQWANTLASESLEIHEAEVGKREEFYSCIERHFLKTLFPGLEDVPVPYATKAPFVFDTKLPPITSDDISFLRSKVPELAEKLAVPKQDESMDKLSDLTSKGGPGDAGLLRGLYMTLATTLQNTLQTTVESASQGTLKSSGQSVKESGGVSHQEDQGDSIGVVPDMCTSDIVVLTHEMSVQAAEGGTLTDAGTVCPAPMEDPILPTTTLPATVLQPIANLEVQADEATTAALPPSSLIKSELNQSVEVLNEDDEEDEFLSLQPEPLHGEVLVSSSPPAFVTSFNSATKTSTINTTITTIKSTKPQPIVVAEPKLKNSTSGSSAELVPRSSGSTGSLQTMALSPTQQRGSRYPHEHRRSSPETSPSLEEVNSEGFTTADFYIDESMPSSMTESPPTRKMVAELQMMLHDKSAQLEAKERDLEQYCKTWDVAREKLSRTEENLKLLHVMAKKGTLQLKCDMLSMEKQIARDKDEFSTYMESVAKKLLDVIEKFEKQQSEQQKTSFEAMKTEKEQQIGKLTEKLEIEMQKLADAQVEIDIYHKQLKDRADQCDSLTNQMTTKVSEMQEEWRTEVEETRKGLMLEHEIEIERNQAEYKLELEAKETSMATIAQTLKETEERAQRQVHEITEKLKSDFETEKKELVEKVQAEYQEKRESLEQEIRDLLSKTHQEELDTQQQEHAQHLQTECERLQSELTEQKLTELTKLNEEAMLQLEAEKQEWRAASEAELLSVEKEHQKVLNDLYDEHTKALEELKATHQLEISELESRHSELVASIDRQHEQALSEAANEHQKALNDLADMHQREVSSVREQLTLEKMSELESMQQHFEMEEERYVKMAVPETSGDSDRLSYEQHQEVVDKYKEMMEYEKTAAVEQALADERRAHELAIERLMEQFDRDKPESIGSAGSTSSISAAAEKQIVFNEALSKVAAEKDKIIEDLKNRESILAQQREEDQRKLGMLLAGKMGQNAELDAAITLAQDREQQLRQLQKAHEEELVAVHAQLRQLQEQMRMSNSVASSAGSSVMSAASSPLKVSGPGGGSAPTPLQHPGSSPLSQPLSQSAIPSVLSQSVFSASSMASSIMPFSDPSCSVSMYERIQELETHLKTKEDEMSEMNQKLTQMSMTTSARTFVQDKVSITTCNVGDIVLLCLDERHDHYVVFNMGTTLHFLHSDCLDILGLKTGGAEARKSWVLAEITDKEYCQAKKAQNRFRVPLGTKFYRVKARCWDREAALQREMTAQRDSPSKTH